MPNWCENELIFSNEEDFKMVCEKFFEKENNTTFFCFDKIISIPENLSENEKYDFVIKNWGTKWEASINYTEEDLLSISFDSAWSPPIGVIKALKEKHGVKGSMRLLYNEPGCGYAGIFYVTESEDFNDEYYDDITKEAKEKLGNYHCVLMSRSIQGVPFRIKLYAQEFGIHLTDVCLVLTPDMERDMDLTPELLEQLMSRVSDAIELYS